MINAGPFKVERENSNKMMNRKLTHQLFSVSPPLKHLPDLRTSFSVFVLQIFSSLAVSWPSVLLDSAWSSARSPFKNKKPENRASLNLVVKAGSLYEEEDQQGLAHFLEHMAFNGTTEYQKNELITYLQSLGLSFGGDLNAYTSFSETV